MPPRSRSFGARGWRLWADLNANGPLAGTDAVVAEEACRIADRLDKLDELLRLKGETWATFRQDFDGESEVTVVVDAALVEARQQATALRGLVAELAKGRPAAPATTKPEPEASASDDLSAKRAARLAGAAAS